MMIQNNYNPLSIKELREILSKKKIFLSKTRGQNFLIDQNIVEKIIKEVPENIAIFEVGPGAGALTKFILEKNHKVYAVEIDKKVYELLKEKLIFKNFYLFHSDFLKFNTTQIPESELFFLSNLPYSISGEAIKKFIEETRFKEGIIMLQKEFVDRMLAKPKSKNFGLISILSHFYLELNTLFEVKRNCFFPVPEVDSTVIRVKKKECKYDQTIFANFIKLSFSERRKTLYNNLKKLNFTEDELTKLSINPRSRPEEIDFREWTILFEYYLSHKYQV